MACFLLVRRDSRDPNDGRPERRALDVLVKRGLTPRLVVGTDIFRLHYCPKMHADEPQIALGTEGTIAVATGAFVYDGTFGRVGLEAFLRDFTPDWSVLDRTLGQFAVVVVNGDIVHLGTDRGGFHHVFLDTDRRCVTDSFLAACSFTGTREVSRTAVLERLCFGSVTGSRTVFANISRLPRDKTLHIESEAILAEKPPLPKVPAPWKHRRDAIEECADALAGLFSVFQRNWRDAIVTPLTGGFDSRLTLAALRAASSRPHCLVYGGDGSADVRIARAICEGEGIPLDHVDREQVPVPSPDSFVGCLEEAFHLQDGRGIDGVFDNGTDVATRKRRARDGSLYINGSGGEIYRNFWRLPAGPRTLQDFLHHRFDRFDRRLLRRADDWRELIDKLHHEYAVLVDCRDGVVSRRQIDALYVEQRLRYWMSPDNQVNNLLGVAIVPYTEPILTQASLALPVDWREHGVFEAALIRRLDARLAAYPSEYGWAFDKQPPLGKRLRSALVLATPAVVRRRHQRQAQRRLQANAPRPFWAGGRWLHDVFGTEPFEMSEYVDWTAIADPKMLNRAFTLELLLRRTR